MKIPTLLTTMLPLALCGCPATYRDFAATTERAYAVSYNADTRSGSLSLTLRPATPPGVQPAPSTLAAAMDDATIEKIVRILAEAARKGPLSARTETPAPEGAK